MNQCECGLCETVPHDSDCAVHNEPESRNGDCDCKAVGGMIEQPDGTVSFDEAPDEPTS